MAGQSSPSDKNLQNELFRASEGAPETRPEGVRVASGLAIDDEGRQSQAYGLAPGEVPTPGTVPLCRAYTNKALSLIGKLPSAFRNSLPPAPEKLLQTGAHRRTG